MNARNPPMSVLAKLGSIVVHLQECHSVMDLAAIVRLVNDQEIQEWLAEADRLALLPKKR
jgi:hypothetical protein